MTRVLLFLLAMFSAAPCGAAEVTRRADGTVFLDGPIVAGDLDRLKAAGLGEDGILSLNSNGGHFQEGLAIARYLFDTKVATIVEAGNSCFSACAVAFLGGAALGEESASLAARSVSSQARLGFHAPFLNLGAGTFTEDEVQAYYDRAVRTIIDLVSSSNVLQIDHGDAAELMRPQRTDLLYLDTAGLLGRYDIAVQGVGMPERLTGTMALSLCANGWDWAHNSRMIDITAFENPDVYADGLTLLEKTGWDGKTATLRMDAGILHTVVPVTAAREAMTMYCVVEQSKTDFGTYVSCLGFFDAEDMKDATAFVRSFGEMRYPCRVAFVVDPIAGYDASFMSVARALVPPATPAAQMADVLAALSRDEKALPAP